ncbi:MAG: glycosyltransferase family 2 protein [Candidatus Woesearchaeota archaeon]
MGPELYYCIAAYNERDNIIGCLDSLAQQKMDLNLETIVCLNGCTDETEKVVQDAKIQYPKLNVKIIHSRKGKAFAQNAIAKSIEHRDVPLMFVDADVSLDKDCTRILFEEMHALEKLIVVGAWPVPYKPEGLNPREIFLYKILHMRAFHPEAEFSVNDVSEYKDYVDARPQRKMSPESEKRSKIYFHGRTFMVRNVSFFYLPEDVNTADDTFLPNYIHTKYGPGTIRTRFDALAHYKPYLSLSEHYRAYRRVFWDLDNIDKKEEFKESRKMEETTINWRYILSQGPLVTLQFLTYVSIAGAEEIVYRIMPKKTLSEVWQYSKK